MNTQHIMRGHLARLAHRTRRARRRRDDRLVRAQLRCREADICLDDALARQRQRQTSALAAHELAASSTGAGPALDRGRRAVSTGAYAVVLLLGWLVNLPVGITTLQVLDESRGLTVMLALLADTVLLAAAHAAGVTLRRAHLQADPWAGLGPEYLIGHALLVLGVGLTLAQALLRWQYVKADAGSTAGPAGVLFGSTLVLASFLIATWCAWQHHHPQVTEHARAERALGRADRAVRRARHRLARGIAGLQSAAAARRDLAESVVVRAERIAAQAALDVLASTSPEAEPDWLARERSLCSLAGPEPVMQHADSFRPLPGAASA